MIEIFFTLHKIDKDLIQCHDEFLSCCHIRTTLVERIY
jgi:hypothetical protein